MQFSITDYLDTLLNKLLNSTRHQIVLTRSWASQFPNKSGVYIFRSGDTIIYAGETGSLRGRMKDMIDTRNHVVRRTLRTKLYADRPTYTKPSARQRFADNLELELNNYIISNLTLSFISVELGRKELEERLFTSHNPEHNNKGQRKTF